MTLKKYVVRYTATFEKTVVVTDEQDVREVAEDIDPNSGEYQANTFEVNTITPASDGVDLSDGGVIEPPEPDIGDIRRRDKDGNCEEVRRRGEEGYQEWADLFHEYFERCEECGETILRTTGSMFNTWHKESCSLHENNNQ